jgi:hypothetical protein
MKRIGISTKIVFVHQLYRRTGLGLSVAKLQEHIPNVEFLVSAVISEDSNGKDR